MIFKVSLVCVPLILMDLVVLTLSNNRHCDVHYRHVDFLFVNNVALVQTLHCSSAHAPFCRMCTILSACNITRSFLYTHHTHINKDAGAPHISFFHHTLIAYTVKSPSSWMYHLWLLGSLVDSTDPCHHCDTWLLQMR